MESVKGNLRKNKPVVDRLQLTTQWSRAQRWHCPTGSEKKPLTAALISDISSSSFQLKLRKDHIYMKTFMSMHTVKADAPVS